MALTEYQIKILRLLSERRKTSGESYVAGGTALNYLLTAPRKSHDIHLFHDTNEALNESWLSDKEMLVQNGYSVDIIREVPSFIEADIILKHEHVLIQWLRDSAFRFFPLIVDDLLGLTLHPFDLATNKILAMSGRLEPRDWIDSIECNRKIQQLGFLAWAASGKDPGVNPQMLLDDANRLHYSQAEIDTLDFEQKPESLALLSQEWKGAIGTGRKIIDQIPIDTLGQCVLDKSGTLYNKSVESLKEDIINGKVYYHKGSIGGAWPQVVS
jgi:hypothetical protein